MTLDNIRQYIQGNMRLAEINHLESHVLEQFLYRFSKMNPRCIKDGQCPCKCPFPGKQLSDGPCDNDCYGFMLDESEWEIFKIKEGVSMRQLKDVYGKALEDAIVK
jgi:hypothetical protein